MWLKHQSICVLCTNNAKYMQLKYAYDISNRENFKLICAISTIEYVNKIACVQFHYVQNSCISLYSLQ